MGQIILLIFFWRHQVMGQFTPLDGALGLQDLCNFESVHLEDEREWDLSQAEQNLNEVEFYLASIAERVDFEVGPTLIRIQKSLVIGQNKDAPVEVRSRALWQAGALLGKIADKKRDRAGARCGGTAIKVLRWSIEVWDKNETASLAYVKGVEGVCMAAEKYTRFFVQMGTKLELKNEAQHALNVLENLNLRKTEKLKPAEITKISESLKRCG